MLKKFGNSINIDKRLYRKDIDASIVHVEMLYSQKIISLKIKNKIVWGLKKFIQKLKIINFFNEDFRYTYEYRK